MDRGVRVVPGLRIRCETDAGGDHEGVAVELEVAAAQPGHVGEAHAGASKDQQQRITAANSPLGQPVVGKCPNSGASAPTKCIEAAKDSNGARSVGRSAAPPVR